MKNNQAKSISIYFLILFQISIVLSALDYNTNYVCVEDGLNIRISDNINSKIIVQVPYKWAILATDNYSKTEKISGMEGRWRTVVFGSNAGWAFDAYFSPCHFVSNVLNPSGSKYYEFWSTGGDNGSSYYSHDNSFSIMRETKSGIFIKKINECSAVGWFN